MRRFSRAINFLRLMFTTPRHRKNVWKSRKVLHQVREISKQSGKFALPKVLNYLRQVDPYVLEETILSAFEDRDLLVWRGLRYSGDGGFDGKVRYKGQWYPIQVKRYAGYVSAEHVKNFSNQLLRLNAKGFFIHTGKTGGMSWENAPQKTAKIISGKMLMTLLGCDMGNAEAPPIKPRN